MSGLQPGTAYISGGSACSPCPSSRTVAHLPRIVSHSCISLNDIHNVLREHGRAHLASETTPQKETVMRKLKERWTKGSHVRRIPRRIAVWWSCTLDWTWTMVGATRTDPPRSVWWPCKRCCPAHPGIGSPHRTPRTADLRCRLVAFARIHLLRTA